PASARPASREALGHDNFEIVRRHHERVITRYIEPVQRRVQFQEKILATLIVQRFPHADDRAKIPAEHLDPVRTAAEAKQGAASCHASGCDRLAEQFRETFFRSPFGWCSHPRWRRKILRHERKGLPPEALRCPVCHADAATRPAYAQQFARSTLRIGRE